MTNEKPADIDAEEDYTLSASEQKERIRKRREAKLQAEDKGSGGSDGTVKTDEEALPENIPHENEYIFEEQSAKKKPKQVPKAEQNPNPSPLNESE